MAKVLDWGLHSFNVLGTCGGSTLIVALHSNRVIVIKCVDIWLILDYQRVLDISVYISEKETTVYCLFFKYIDHSHQSKYKIIKIYTVTERLCYCVFGYNYNKYIITSSGF